MWNDKNTAKNIQNGRNKLRILNAQIKKHKTITRNSLVCVRVEFKTKYAYPISI